MRIRLDPWPVDVEGGQMSLQRFDGSLIDIETPRWEAIQAQSIPEQLSTVHVVDGMRRMECRVLIEDTSGETGIGGFGAFVVGAVELCPHGSRSAALIDVRARRLLAHTPGLKVDPYRLLPRNPHTGQLDYQTVVVDSTDPLAPLHKLQQVMLGAEQELSHGLATPVPFDESDHSESLTALTLQDGTLRSKNLGGAVVGCVKTMQTLYLPDDRAPLLAQLKPAQRTPILHMQYANGTYTRFIWYVRLCEAVFYQHPLSGVMRLEMYAPDEPDFLPPIVREIANMSGALLCRLASQAHKDPRAPQNLIPTAALESAMSRAMGNVDLVTRRLRAHIARELGVVA